MGEKREGEKLLNERGLTPEIIVAFRAVVAKVAGRRFRSAGRLAEGMAGMIWNPWNFEGGASYVKAVADSVAKGPELFGQLGVATVEVSSWRDRVLRRNNTVLYLIDPMPAGNVKGANTPTQEWPFIGSDYAGPTGAIVKLSAAELEPAAEAEVGGEDAEN